MISPALKPGPATHLLLSLALVVGVATFHSASAAHAAVGSPIGNGELPMLQGGKAFLLKDVEANVIVFIRPNQQRSLDMLRELVQCQTGFVGKSVHWVTVVSSLTLTETVAAMLADTGFNAPVLLDRGDTLYGSLGLAMHPVVVVVSRDNKLVAVEPFRTVNFCSVIGARIQYLLHEISDADLSSALEPPKSSQGGTAQVARRYRALAEALYRSKNYDKALENVRKSLDKDPQLASAHVLLGQILLAQGDCAEAVLAFNQALVNDPASMAASEGLDRCKSAR